MSLIPADIRTRGGTIRPMNTSELTPHWEIFFWHRNIPDWNSLPEAASFHPARPQKKSTMCEYLAHKANCLE